MDSEAQKIYTFTKSPSYLVLLVIAINIGFGFFYIIILLIEETFDVFGSAKLANLGYDTLLLIGIILIQQIIYGILLRRRYTETYTINNNQIEHKKGIFTKHEDIYSLNNIVSMEINKNFWGNILNYGDIIVVYIGSPVGITIKKISDPEHLISLMKQQ